MQKMSSWSLWFAGILALLGAVGIADLNFSFLFVQIDALMLVVGVICILNAYMLGRTQLRP